MVHWSGQLAADKRADNAFVVALTIPADMGITLFRQISLLSEITISFEIEERFMNFFF